MRPAARRPRPHRAELLDRRELPPLGRRGDEVQPITLGIHQYIGAHVGDRGAVMAASVLSAVPAAVLLVLAQKYIAAGLPGGSAK
ncbi:hypothetical protein SGLAU_03440 [Streptomyces glaucescens]|uniref:ABC transmembrane type-1 domain-containing protein n=1 Tax=Streptomyces glaucescens TaxID=1907 RepID=A0A089X4D3_STRGA|nr:hypothetical protein SGLAU_03440 [Streptomyces glaucescens]